MPSKEEINELIHRIVRSQKDLKYALLYENDFNKWINDPYRHRYSESIDSAELYRRLVFDKIITRGRSVYGALRRYTQRPGVYRKSISEFLPEFDNYLKQKHYLSQKYGWNTPLVATRFRKPSVGNQIENNDITSGNDIPSRNVSSGSSPPVEPPSTPPPSPPTSNSPPSPDNDDDGKNKAPKRWGVYKHDFTDILKGVDRSDIYKNKKQDSKALSAEKENTKGVNENTKALFSLRSFLGPYAKLAMPFYAANLLYQTGAASTDASLERVRRRTFGGLYGASMDRRGYRRMFNAMTSYGASEEDVLREYSGQKKWASTLMFGMGLDKIEALAMVLGKAPGPAEMRDPELMQRWLRENMRGITDMQAMQLSAMGVASDTFIESARKGQAVDIEGRTATARETYNVLGKQTGNPIKKLGYKIAANQAYAIESVASGNAGKMLQIGALGSNYGMYAPALESERIREENYNESKELIPQQTNVTVNINGNIDSEERAHSFAEQIGAEVSNAEK